MAITITETRGHVAEMTPNSHFSVPVTMDRNGRSRSPKYAADLLDADAQLGLLDRVCDLLFSELALPHGMCS